LEFVFLCVGLLGGLFLCHAPFLWGKVRDPSASTAVSVLCWFADCFSVLQRHLTLDVALVQEMS
jgi:hypothetical protein